MSGVGGSRRGGGRSAAAPTRGCRRGGSRARKRGTRPAVGCATSGAEGSAAAAPVCGRRGYGPPMGGGPAPLGGGRRFGLTRRGPSLLAATSSRAGWPRRVGLLARWGVRRERERSGDRWRRAATAPARAGGADPDAARSGAMATSRRQPPPDGPTVVPPSPPTDRRTASTPWSSNARGRAALLQSRDGERRRVAVRSARRTRRQPRRRRGRAGRGPAASVMTSADIGAAGEDDSLAHATGHRAIR